MNYDQCFAIEDLVINNENKVRLWWQHAKDLINAWKQAHPPQIYRKISLYNCLFFLSVIIKILLQQILSPARNSQIIQIHSKLTCPNTSVIFPLTNKSPGNSFHINLFKINLCRKSVIRYQLKNIYRLFLTFLYMN